MPRAAINRRRGVFARCQPVPHDDVFAVREHWCSLTVEAKLKILRFEDPPLVERLYEIQQTLYAGDFECHMLGVCNAEVMRQEAGAEFFDVEGVIAAGGLELSPKVFFVRQGLVENDQFFSVLEEKLGRPFLRDVPDLERSRWALLLTEMPRSWRQFVRVILNLVELALLESQRATKQREETEVRGKLDEQAQRMQQLFSELEEGQTQTTKRKKTKKKQSRAQAPQKASPNACLKRVAENDMCAETEVVNGHDVSQHNDFELPADLDVAVVESSAQATAHGTQFFTIHSPKSPGASPCSLTLASEPANWQEDQVPLASASRLDNHESAQAVEEVTGLFEVDLDCRHEESVLATWQALQDAREARITAEVAPILTAFQASRACAREARIRAELQASRGRIRPPWLLGDGSSGEHWVDGFRTVTKNTFIDVEELCEHESSALRAHSAP
eukprot:TRINITY_DN96742_c0_g1_i1.p1 TRINITY_DN96742_c0_g1~~TRINITY_DN96742_c0_g1_i1.p1  ORF type:complete len:446 (+),score=66.36 TRINITY_DN96742_c0_g1_i1:28-1365(+)